MQETITNLQIQYFDLVESTSTDQARLNDTDIMHSECVIVALR